MSFVGLILGKVWFEQFVFVGTAFVKFVVLGPDIWERLTGKMCHLPSISLFGTNLGKTTSGAFLFVGHQH